ncbi:MAG: hypothetical protein A2831_00525 [Candidatus Yanofskybacteria bacterium RIFCSPHIGHO2_01_FULL_44_17]|uniref:UDP-N-acetylglucosamine 2-epimerase domain-containing protein n=1 Tax=Candidatus Yanofskybacteria bacterium RIFCSPHIGHO2_01_FULL_44_17 TaxID=1802668 RepID=A0A1F8EXQ8_9BACT|nr:MAG: hypothetical protein A2831_00525 [Candidatus Yanofskybacteria bacterium RIFCSPHIGHO2_01_FULL_44_17]
MAGKGLIWAVCKDPGGTNGVLPVVDELRKIGYEVLLIANGNALERLPTMNIPFLTLEEALAKSTIPDIFLTSMCYQGGVGRNLIPLMRSAGVPVITLQDFWGAQLKPEWEDRKFRPRFVCANDEVGADIIQRAWPGFHRSCIEITGFPAMDKYASLDVGGTSKKVREGLGIPADGKVVLYCDQIDYAGEVLTELVESLNSLGRNDIYFIPRMHPRLPKDNPDGFPKFQEAMKLFRAGTLIADSSRFTTSEVITAATVVLSMYSTVNIEASCIRKQNISMLYPDYGMGLFLKGANGIMDEFPLVSLGCSTKVTNRQELVAALTESLGSGLGLVSAQEKAFQLDGKNAFRVANLVKHAC